MSLSQVIAALEASEIPTHEPQNGILPPSAVLHDLSAIAPKLIISPRTESDVTRTLKILYQHNIYPDLPVSIRSGGHGYFNGATCSGIMLNMGGMTQCRIQDNVLYIEPGMILGQLAWTLAQNRKAVPHGDCFGVGAGGHFTTAGWDMALARRYGLGCQRVIGGRMVLWDGEVVDVNEEEYPDLLHATRGGAGAGVGVITQIRLQLIDEPPCVTRCFRVLCEKKDVEKCVRHNAFSNARKLPDEVSISFRLFFEPDQRDPKCSFNVVSLLSSAQTLEYLTQYLGPEVASLVSDQSYWIEDSLLSLRLIPASDTLKFNSSLLADVTPEALQDNPLAWWHPTVSAREMARSYFTSISHWVDPTCSNMLFGLYDVMCSARDTPLRSRMYALLIQGGGQMTAMQDQCSMPLGQALARFELHWDDHNEESWSRKFTGRIESILEKNRDRNVQRPYRGDIWLQEQAEDDVLEKIWKKYNRKQERVEEQGIGHDVLRP